MTWWQQNVDIKKKNEVGCSPVTTQLLFRITTLKKTARRIITSKVENLPNYVIIKKMARYIAEKLISVNLVITCAAIATRVLLFSH
jgi:hypothetical protein